MRRACAKDRAKRGVPGEVLWHQANKRALRSLESTLSNMVQNRDNVSDLLTRVDARSTELAGIENNACTGSQTRRNNYVTGS